MTNYIVFKSENYVMSHGICEIFDIFDELFDAQATLKCLNDACKDKEYYFAYILDVKNKLILNEKLEVSKSSRHFEKNIKTDDEFIFKIAERKHYPHMTNRDYHDFFENEVKKCDNCKTCYWNGNKKRCKC